MVLTQPDSKCLAAVWTVIPVPQTLKILLTNFYNGCIVKTQHVAAYEITRKEVTSMFKTIILHNRTAMTILTVNTRTNRILPSDFCTHSWSRTLKIILSSYFGNLTTHGQLWNIITALFCNCSEPCIAWQNMNGISDFANGDWIVTLANTIINEGENMKKIRTYLWEHKLAFGLAILAMIKLRYI